MVSTTSPNTAAAPIEWRPSVNPWMVAVSVMLATFMVVLDSSVANVALPHIAGNLSASTDESTWVLTSYLVSNAIMLPAAGWITRRIGRKRLFMISIMVFTGASLLCGIAINLPMLILARILQGFGGGGMQPLAQSILLESFPPRQHGTAMAVYGAGIVVAPVIGPTLGMDYRQLFLALDLLHQSTGGFAGPDYGQPVHRRPSLHQTGISRGNRLSRVRVDGRLAGHIAVTAGQGTGGGLVCCDLDTMDHCRFRDRIGRIYLSRIHGSRADCTIACAQQPQLRRRYADHRHLRLCTLWHHGSFTFIPADPDGVSRTRQRSGRQSTRHWLVGVHDCGRDIGQICRRPSTFSLWFRDTRLLDHSVESHQSWCFHGFDHRTELTQRLLWWPYLCSPYHHDHGQAAQRGDRQCVRHLQPDAKHWGQHRYRERHHRSGARLADPSELFGGQHHGGKFWGS